MRPRGRTFKPHRNCTSTTPSTRVQTEILSQRIANTTSQIEVIFSPEVCKRRVFSAFLTVAQTSPSNVIVLSKLRNDIVVIIFSGFLQETFTDSTV